MQQDLATGIEEKVNLANLASSVCRLSCCCYCCFVLWGWYWQISNKKGAAWQGWSGRERVDDQNGRLPALVKSAPALEEPCGIDKQTNANTNTNTNQSSSEWQISCSGQIGSGPGMGHVDCGIDTHKHKYKYKCKYKCLLSALVKLAPCKGPVELIHIQI